MLPWESPATKPKVHSACRWCVLASYGLLVNTDGLLQSPANADAPTRQANAVIEPGGDLGKWCRKNGARKSLRMLYRSAYTAEAVYGNKAQQLAGTAQLVPNTKGRVATAVGMSMAPAIWSVNFALIYTLNPAKAAKMPARWTPIPCEVVDAIEATPTGAQDRPLTDVVIESVTIDRSDS